MEVAVMPVRSICGKCKAVARKVPAIVNNTTNRRYIRKRHPARSSHSFQKMDRAKLIGPSGGLSGDRRLELSWICSGVIYLFRIMFGVTFEAREVIVIAARDGVTRYEPVHSFADEAGHGVVAAHAHNSYWRTLGRRRGDSLQFPTFQAFDAVAVAESPLE